MPQSTSAALPTAADVDAAAQRLAGVALRTPLITSPVLDAITKVWEPDARIFCEKPFTGDLASAERLAAGLGARASLIGRRGRASSSRSE